MAGTRRSLVPDGLGLPALDTLQFFEHNREFYCNLSAVAEWEELDTEVSGDEAPSGHSPTNSDDDGDMDHSSPALGAAELETGTLQPEPTKRNGNK